MKVAPLIRALDRYNLKQSAQNKIDYHLVHIGQHYDYEMSKVFFRDLKLAQPDIYLGVGSDGHAGQTAKTIIRFEKVLSKEKPDLVIVLGDVNSTLACAITASKLCIPVAHVEAGLRSFDRRMPEEVNRIVTDILSDYLFTSCEDADRNLVREGVAKKKIFFTGNIMIDSLQVAKDRAKKLTTYANLGLKKKDYVLLTLHRPENVDDKKIFAGILGALREVQEKVGIIFPVHPRTKKRIELFGFKKYFSSPRKTHSKDYAHSIILIEPLGYLKFLNLMINSLFVITDSGGVQEETTVLSIPCLTLRKNTERPVTVTFGTNRVIGTDRKQILREASKILNDTAKKGSVPKLWDGKTAERIINIITNKLRDNEKTLRL